MKKTIEEKIAEKCMKQQATISTAESCTGGMVASTLVNVAGISSVFREGYITYSNGAKERILGVSEDTLRKHGAVSAETAYEMALGCARTANSDYSIVTTGIAGPDGGTPEKPVGLVYIGCYAKGKVYTKECHFNGDRMEIRQAAAQTALEFLEENIYG